MNSRCSNCALKFEREPGYFIVAMYLNYGVTAILVTAGIFIFDSFAQFSYFKILGFWGVVCIVFPAAFFRFAKSLWLNIDFLFDPE